MALLSYYFLKGKMPAWVVFTGEIIAISFCWCPTTILYNYLTYFLFLAVCILLYRGLIWNLSLIHIFFRNFLPETFQYFGLWGLFCFGLQGAFGSVLIKHYCKHDLVSIIGSIFFVITPIEIYRMFMHLSLIHI